MTRAIRFKRHRLVSLSGMSFSEALELGQFSPSWLFPSGFTRFLLQILDFVSSRNRDAFAREAKRLY